jgi:hypothetical protein
MNKIVLISALLLFVFVSGVAFSVWAAPADDTETKGIVRCAGDSCTLCELFQTILRVINFCIKILIPLTAALLIAYGGFKMIVSPGNVDAATQAKAIITVAIVGLVIIYGGWVMVDTFMQKMSYNANVKWYNVPCSSSMIQPPAATMAMGIFGQGV